MDPEEKICRHYEAILASIAALDYGYYAKRTPTRAERAAHFARQEEREAVRNQFYSELDAIRRGLPARRPN